MVDSVSRGGGGLDLEIVEAVADLCGYRFALVLWGLGTHE
jgi:hypothetical protein